MEALQELVKEIEKELKSPFFSQERYLDLMVDYYSLVGRLLSKSLSPNE